MSSQVIAKIGYEQQGCIPDYEKSVVEKLRLMDVEKPFGGQRARL